MDGGRTVRGSCVERKLLRVLRCKRWDADGKYSLHRTLFLSRANPQTRVFAGNVQWPAPQVIWDTALEAADINMPILAPLRAGFRSRGGGMNRLAAEPSNSGTRPVCELRLCERHVECRTLNICASLWCRRRTRAKGLDRRDKLRRGKERCVFYLRKSLGMIRNLRQRARTRCGIRDYRDCKCVFMARPPLAGLVCGNSEKNARTGYRCPGSYPIYKINRRHHISASWHARHGAFGREPGNG
jgi:hypothetical protein